ncbi:hypothetical protein EV368DRAFT_86344 [Lentinula lateritia]|nr:hypothetical protein EV368DRAFT_86344 [Lentinula lateritia]
MSSYSGSSPFDSHCFTDQDFHELPSFEGLNNLNADDLAFNALIQSSGFSEALMNLDFDHTLPGLDGPSALRVGASSNLAASGEVANSFVPSSAQLTNSLFLPNEGLSMSPPFQDSLTPASPNLTHSPLPLSLQSVNLYPSLPNSPNGSPHLLSKPTNALSPSSFITPPTPLLTSMSLSSTPHLVSMNPPPTPLPVPLNSSPLTSFNDPSATLNCAAANPLLFSCQPTTHAERNPLLPTQSIHARATRHLDAVQSRTMHEAKVEKQKLDLLLKQDVIKLMTTFEEMTASLAHKHHRTPAYVKELISTTSHLSRQKATGRMQALIHIESKEVNSTLPVGSKLKAPALRKLVDEDAELLALSDEKVQEAQKEVDTEFDGLHVCTGAIGFGMLTPGAREDRGLPLWFVAGPDTAKFVRQHLNMTMWDLLGLLELWANSKHNHRFNRSFFGKEIPLTNDYRKTFYLGRASITMFCYGHIGSLKTVAMNYNNYHTNIVAKYHVQLIGLPPALPEPVKPFDISDRWNMSMISNGKEVGKERVERSDKGTKRGPRKRTNNDDDDDDNNETNKPVQKHRRRKAPSQKASGISAGSRTKTTAPNAKRMRISKQLPPLPRSREFIDDDDEDQDQLIQNAEGEQSLARNRGGEGEDVEEDEDVVSST